MSLYEQMRPAALRNAASANEDIVTNVLDRNDFGRAQEWVILVSVGQISGQNPEFDIRIQHSEDADSWEEAPDGNFPMITGVGLYEHVVVNTRRFIRATAHLGGTSPNIEIAVIAIAGQPVEGPI